MIRAIIEFAEERVRDLNALLSAFLRGTQGEYGMKKGSGGGTDINTPGRTLRKK